MGFSHRSVLVVGWWILVLGLLPWVMGLLIGVVEWRGGDQRGGFLDWQWWVLALWLSVRLTVSLCVCIYVFFFSLW